jgi:hypothetical protein
MSIDENETLRWDSPQVRVAHEYARALLTNGSLWDPEEEAMIGMVLPTQNSRQLGSLCDINNVIRSATRRGIPMNDEELANVLRRRARFFGDEAMEVLAVAFARVARDNPAFRSALAAKSGEPIQHIGFGRLQDPKTNVLGRMMMHLSNILVTGGDIDKTFVNQYVVVDSSDDDDDDDNDDDIALTVGQKNLDGMDIKDLRAYHLETEQQMTALEERESSPSVDTLSKILSSRLNKIRSRLVSLLEIGEAKNQDNDKLRDQDYDDDDDDDRSSHHRHRKKKKRRKKKKSRHRRRGGEQEPELSSSSEDR